MFKKAVPILIAVLFVITVVSCIMIADTVMRSDAEIEDFESLAAITRKPIESESSETTS